MNTREYEDFVTVTLEQCPHVVRLVFREDYDIDNMYRMITSMRNDSDKWGIFRRDWSTYVRYKQGDLDHCYMHFCFKDANDALMFKLTADPRTPWT